MPTKGPEAGARKRFNMTGKGRYADWGRYFDRFNLDKEPNEPNRFGWIVEIDPYDPNHTSVKRTALGRCAHECATHAVSHDGRVAIYSGDDARMEYVYKFVTEGKFDPKNREANRDLLDRGTLYAARFEANGKMRWLPLVHGQGPLTAANGFASQADVLIEARRAGDAARRDADGPARGRRGASAHRPRLRGHDLQRAAHRRAGEPGQPARRTTSTATSSRSCRRSSAASPTTPRPSATGASSCSAAIRPSRSTRARYGGPVSANGWVAAPDNVAFDPKGRIWISTDGQDDAAGFNDSLYAAQRERPEPRRDALLLQRPARLRRSAGRSSRPTAGRCSSRSSTRATARPSTSPRRAGRTSGSDLPPRGSVVAITRDRRRRDRRLARSAGLN